MPQRDGLVGRVQLASAAGCGFGEAARSSVCRWAAWSRITGDRRALARRRSPRTRPQLAMNGRVQSPTPVTINDFAQRPAVRNCKARDVSTLSATLPYGQTSVEVSCVIGCREICAGFN
jgi:hypothetical protein